MKEIVNKTQRPVRVPLPGGKFLHLGPAKAGQVSDQATQLPSFQRLLKEGTIELLGEGNRSVDAGRRPRAAARIDPRSSSADRDLAQG